jgi:hypothetical protein
MEREVLDKKLPLNCPITQEKCWQVTCAWWTKTGCAVKKGFESLVYLENVSIWCDENWGLGKLIGRR